MSEIYIPPNALASPLDPNGVIRVDVDGGTKFIRVEEFAEDPVFTSQYAPLGEMTIDDARDGDGVLYSAHRGASYLYPENLMVAFRSIVAQGAKALETDVYLLRDGSLGIMHDTTIDRTTTASGNTADQTAATWQVLSSDYGATTGGAFTSYTERPPMFDEVLREFGNKVVLAPEAKNTGSGAAMVAAFQRYGIRPNAVIVQSFFLDELAPAIAAGYFTAYLGTGETNATLVAAGVDMVIHAWTESEATFTTALAAGLEVGAYTLNRQYERDLVLGYGATYITSSDPIYVSGQHTKLASDPFDNGTWYHGQQSSVSNRGTFDGSVADSWGFNGLSTATYQGGTQGWASPITFASFTVEFDVKFTTSSATGRWAGIFLGTTDRLFTDATVTDLFGYHFIGRNTSYLNMYRVVNGAVGATLATSGTVTAIADGGTASFKLTVTPSTLTFERTDVAVSTGAIADTTYRPAGGWYLTLGRNGVAAEFSNVVITEL